MTSKHSKIYDISKLEIRDPVSAPTSTRFSTEVASPSIHQSPIKDLMNIRKDILHTLWTDIDETWSNREDFIHLHFTDGHQNYKPISSETMRVFEIRRLDLRIQGLIEQREDVLRRLKHFGIGNGSSPDAKRSTNSDEHSSSPSRQGTLRNSPSKYASLFQNKDRESFLKYMTEELQIFRTLTLYITEYILTWCEKQPNKNTYYWNPEASRMVDSDETYGSDSLGSGQSLFRKSRSRNLFAESIDYINKMATDFVQLVYKSRRLQQILADLQLTISPLCLPKYPRLYYEHDKNSTFEISDFAKMPTEDFMATASQRLETSIASRQGRKLAASQSRTALINSSGVANQNNGTKAITDSARKAQLDVRVPSPNPYYQNDDGVSSARNEGGPQGSKSGLPTSPLSRNTTHFFLTETDAREEQSSPPPVVHDSDDEDYEPEIEFEQPSDSKPPINIHSLQQYLELPALLVQQTYQDRQKRYKRYSEPLLSVRHEDLLREATLNDFGGDSALHSGGSSSGGMAQFSNGMSRTGRKTKQNKYTDQVLSKKLSPGSSKNLGGTHLKLSSKRTHTYTKSSQRNNRSSTNNADAQQIEFKPPNHAKQLNRCQQAQDKLVLHYQQLRRNPKRRGGSDRGF